jgi:hypothetical protein
MRRTHPIGKLALCRGWISRDDLRQCLVEQRWRRRLGGRIRLGQIMVRRDLISTSQLVALLDNQKTGSS